MTNNKRKVKMKKRLFLIAVALLLFSSLFVGCGVARDKYDTVVADLGKAQQELQSVKADLSTSQQKLQSTEAELESKQTELKTAQTELEIKNTTVASLKSAKTSLIAEKESLQSNYNKLNDENNSVTQELANIKKVYPARYFTSLTELRDWLYGNNISERQANTTAEGLYAKALDLQEAAMKDGYIISAFIENLQGNNFLMGCKAVIDGNIYSWDVETDEPVDWSGMYGLLKVR
jgi:Skp family chaperone for outer membrane proteins